jgi:serine/threonine protein kinase
MGVCSSQPGLQGINVKYDIREQIGKGAFSEVRVGTERTSGRIVAVKIIDMEKLQKQDEKDALDMEVLVHGGLVHKNIVHFIEDFHYKTDRYLVLEHCKGGELFEEILERDHYSENSARLCINSIASALAFCHERGIAHRDIKPENILLSSSHSDANIKIADFGFAKHLDATGKLHTILGTPSYIAPEILRRHPYGTGVDVWSMGIIAYILLCGYPPFATDKGQKALFRKIAKGPHPSDDKFFEPEYWGDVSPGAKRLIRKMLTVDVNKRVTCAAVLNDPWTTGTAADTHLNVKTNLKKFNARRKLRAGIRGVMAANRLRHTVAMLTKAAADLALDEGDTTPRDSTPRDGASAAAEGVVVAAAAAEPNMEAET